jgi:hypothetical protein
MTGNSLGNAFTLRARSLFHSRKLCTPIAAQIRQDCACDKSPNIHSAMIEFPEKAPLVERPGDISGRPCNILLGSVDI